jgi:glucose/arabinose dehydrogenase
LPGEGRAVYSEGQRIMRITIGLAVLALGLCLGSASAQGKPPAEEDYYRLVRFTIPPGVVLEAGALEMLPDGRLAVGTRRGEVWLVDRACAADPAQARFTRFAHGLQEILGLAWRDGWLYVTQRPELTRLKDSDGDGKADVFETVSDGWEISGDYHEYAFGSRFDRQGQLWVVLCLTGSYTSDVRYRGWCLRISPEGRVVPTCSGIRSPGGIGMNAEGDMFYTDNQGPWNGACGLKHLVPGGFMGHPAGLRWHAQAPGMGPAPAEPRSGSRMIEEARRISQLVPTAVLFPYGAMGQSASGIECDESGGRFGPFGRQLFVADQAHSTVMRVFLEKVAGRYQGACFPFRQGFGSGNVPLRFGPDGSLFVGGTSRGWASRGSQPFALERLVWTGKVPFEIHEMRARPDGFELTFTEPVDPRTAADPRSWRMRTYTYIYRAEYGSPEVDPTTPTIRRAVVAADGKSVRLEVGPLQPGHVHELHADGLRSAAGLPLLHPEAYYTLNAIPTATAASAR